MSSRGHSAEGHPHARLIRDFHERQNRFYAGEDEGHVSPMLAADVVWHVPGRSALAGDHRANLDLEASEFGELFGSEDAKEGMTAFVEKREPSFVGR